MGVPTRTQVSQLHFQQDFLLPAAGRETLQRSALERMLNGLSTCPRRFCPALTREVAFLAAFTLQLAISGPGWQVLTEVSDALCSSRSPQLRSSLLSPSHCFFPLLPNWAQCPCPFSAHAEATGSAMRARAESAACNPHHRPPSLMVMAEGS